MSSESFYCLSPREFDEALVHYGRNIKFKMDFQRAAFTNLLNINIEEKDRLTPEQLFPMKWDKKNDAKENEIIEFTDEEARKYDDFNVGNL